jgi:hypothetical protein
MTPGVYESLPDADPLSLSHAELEDRVAYELFWSPYIDASTIEITALTAFCRLQGRFTV